MNDETIEACYDFEANKILIKIGELNPCRICFLLHSVWIKECSQLIRIVKLCSKNGAYFS